MKRTITYFLLALLLLQHSGRLAVLVWFEVNQPEIARTLCENRSRPDLHCNGQCVLAKRLKAIEERGKQQAAMVAPILQVVCYVLPDLFSFDFAPTTRLVSHTASFSYQALTPILTNGDFFRPPRF